MKSKPDKAVGSHQAKLTASTSTPVQKSPTSPTRAPAKQPVDSLTSPIAPVPPSTSLVESSSLKSTTPSTTQQRSVSPSRQTKSTVAPTTTATQRPSAPATLESHVTSSESNRAPPGLKQPSRTPTANRVLKQEAPVVMPSHASVGSVGIQFGSLRLGGEEIEPVYVSFFFFWGVDFF